MTRARQETRPVWPFGPTDAASRARVVAHYTLAALAEVDPDKAAQVIAIFEPFGETYLRPSWHAHDAAGLSDDVATLAAVSADTVRMWRTRGIVRAGQRLHLTPRQDGTHDPTDVDAFLRARDTQTSSCEAPPCRSTRPTRSCRGSSPPAGSARSRCSTSPPGCSWPSGRPARGRPACAPRSTGRSSCHSTTPASSTAAAA